MSKLLAISAAVEAVAGLALVLLPPLFAELLLGTTLMSPTSHAVARLAGTALLALSTACWFARNDGASRAARGVVAALLVYNVGAVAILVYAGTVLGFFSDLLWPAVALHAALAAWCVTCLRSS